MYKDKDKQRAMTKERVRRYRAKQKGVTSEGVTLEDVTVQPVLIVIPDRQVIKKAILFRQPLTKARQLSKRGFNDNIKV